MNITQLLHYDLQMLNGHANHEACMRPEGPSDLPGTSSLCIRPGTGNWVIPHPILISIASKTKVVDQFP